AFCLEAEQFVDDRLSNWYVRRNRRRFWKSEQGEDKLAAYQTLYAVLTTLVKLAAPIMPFLAEAMYRNLRPGSSASESWPESVHLCSYPEVDDSLVDRELSNDMDTAIELVALGLAARNARKLKVRQPLVEMKVPAYFDSVTKAVERF